MSSILYNKGLSQAQTRNLSGAVLSLTESLQIDKKHTDARNLLGLICFEMGLVGDAVKHWIISTGFQKQNNRASLYLTDIERNTSSYERLNEAVRAYNMAIEYVERENDDLAILRLKKAVELSPNFVQAMNLLAFCYLLQKNSRGALSMIERVLLIDEGNETALRYYKTITGVKMKAAAMINKPSGTVKEDVSQPEPPFVEARTVKTENEKRATLFNDILFFSIGAIIAVSVMYALVIPAIVQNATERAGELADELISLNEMHQIATADMSGRIDDLELEIETLEETVAAQSEQISHFESIQVVTAAQWLLDDGNVIGAAEVIYNANLSGLPVDVLEKAEEIIAATYSYTAARLYNDGISAFNAGNFADARTSLESALRFSRVLGSNLDNIYFYLGSAELNLGNTEAAAAHFRIVVDDYPNSAVFSRAYEELGQLND